MSFTDDLETRVLQWALTSGSPIRPTAWYIGLFTAAPGEAGGGTEVSGGAYVREAATLSVTGNTATTAAAIEWPTATASWGTITHVAIFDASTAGNMLAYATLDASKTISTGDVLRIPAGSFTVTLD